MHHSCKLAANFSDLGSDILRYYERLLTKNRSITGEPGCVHVGISLYLQLCTL